MAVPGNKNIVLVNPPYASIYRKSKIREGAPYSPVLSLATIAALPLKRGYNVRIVDMNMLGEPQKEKFLGELKKESPGYVGITFATPLYEEMMDICRWVKEYDGRIKIIGGGVHATSFPEGTLSDTPIDIVAVGEGDFTLLDILESEDISSVKGIYYKDKNGRIIRNPGRDRISDLDGLPFPAWGLYDIKKYRTTDLLTRKNPAGWLETSRGCIHGCVYCSSRNVHGSTFRAKSPDRVIKEMGYMMDCGFKEIHISDDCFNTDIDRAKDICKLIINKGLSFPWSAASGIRVDNVDRELLSLMRKAGCYRVFYGIESGDERVLKNIKKGITLNQVIFAVKAAKEARLEVCGFFMIGLPGETVESMRKTVEFARTLDLDMVKMAVTVPLPATPLYNEWVQQGLIKKAAWSKYNLHSIPKDIFDHPNLRWEDIERCYENFYRAFYWRPSYIFKRLVQDIKKGRLLSDIGHFIKTDWS